MGRNKLLRASHIRIGLEPVQQHQLAKLVLDLLNSGMLKENLRPPQSLLFP